MTHVHNLNPSTMKPFHHTSSSHSPLLTLPVLHPSFIFDGKKETIHVLTNEGLYKHRHRDSRCHVHKQCTPSPTLRWSPVHRQISASGVFPNRGTRPTPFSMMLHIFLDRESQVRKFDADYLNFIKIFFMKGRCIILIGERRGEWYIPH